MGASADHAALAPEGQSDGHDDGGTERFCVSKFVSVNLSGATGTAIPMVSKSLGFDPAMTAGRFETALQDVLGIAIFLSLATALLPWLV